MTVEKKPAASIWEAISKGDVDEVADLLSRNPDQINAYIPFGGGTFLHLAASDANLDMVKRLVELGFDINKGGSNDGETPIVVAADNGNYDVVKYLIASGARLDVGSSARNPLFGAIVGRSIEIVRLLLESGIDSSVRYTSETMTDMDAIAFALERGEREIAATIAEWNADGGRETQVQSLGETVTVEDGAVQLAFDLSASAAGYLIITQPTEGSQGLDEFFGADHYVEVKDQGFGFYGGIERLTVSNDRVVVLRLSNETPGVGREVSITTADPMTADMLRHLRRLQRS